MTQIWWVECFECGFDGSGAGWCWDGKSLKGVESECFECGVEGSGVGVVGCGFDGFGVRVFGNFEIK